MPSRNELNARARVLGFDPSTIANDSKLEQHVLYLEKNATTVSATLATGTLTSDATAPSNGDTVTIGSVTYTYKTTLTGAANEVLIGASADAALDNLKSAINGTGTAGTDYSAATGVHPQVTATTNTATTQVVAARDAAVSNGSIATTETSSHLSWGASTLASGVAGTVAAAGATTKDTNAGIAGDKNANV